MVSLDDGRVALRGGHHQRRHTLLVARVRGSAGVEEQLHDRKTAGGRRIGQGGSLAGIGVINLRAGVEQRLELGGIPAHGGLGQLHLQVLSVDNRQSREQGAESDKVQARGTGDEHLGSRQCTSPSHSGH